MSTLIGVTEDKTEVFLQFTSFKRRVLSSISRWIFSEGIVSENESG